MLNLGLIFAESDVAADLADGLRGDIEERGDVLQIKELHETQIQKSGQKTVIFIQNTTRNQKFGHKSRLLGLRRKSNNPIIKNPLSSW